MVIDSFTPKSQDTGEPGRERMLADTCWITSRCRVGLSGGLEVMRMGPICLIRWRLSRLSALNFGSSGSGSGSGAASTLSPSAAPPPLPPSSSLVTPFSSSAWSVATGGGGTSLAASLVSHSISPFSACRTCIRSVS